MKDHSRTEYSILNIATGVGGYILSVLLSLVNRMVFTQCLPASYLGISGLFSNVLAMLSLAELGVGGAISYALYKPLAEKNEEKIASLMKVYATAYRTVGAVIAICGVLVLPFLNLVVGEQAQIQENLHLIFLIYLAESAGSYFFTYRSSLLVAAQKNYLVTGLNYAILCIQAVAQAAFLYLTRNYIGYLLIQLCFSMLNYVWISHIAIKQFPCIAEKNVQPLPIEERKRIFKDMRDLMAYKVSGVLVNGTDSIIITFFVGLSMTGLTSNYTLLVNTLKTLLNQVFGGLTASVGNLNALESEEKKFSMMKIINLLNFWLFSWATVGILFVSSDLVSILFGESYVLDPFIPFIMALNFYTVGMQHTMWTFKHTMGLFRYGRFVQLWTAMLNVVFSILMGKMWGVSGILLATLVSRLFTNLWYDPYVIYKHAFGKNPLTYLVRYLVYLLVLAVEIAVCSILNRCLLFPPVVSLMAKVVMVSIVCNVVFFLAFCRTPELGYILQLMGKILRLVYHRLSWKRPQP